MDGEPGFVAQGRSAWFSAKPARRTKAPPRAGVPVVAFARDRGGTKARWYRRRQQGLLGDALAVSAGSAVEAARGVSDILNDPARRRQMSETGRARLGAGGGAQRIADRIASLTRQS